MSKNNWAFEIFQKIKNSLERVNSYEPCVKQNRDRFGNLSWRIYDRRTNRSYTFASEREVIAWLEQHYYRV